MSSLRQTLASSVIKKMVTSITGLGLIAYAIFHLLGNLTLFSRSSESFNFYAAKIQELGFLILIAELGLAAFFIIHIVNGIRLKKNHMDARPIRYQNSIRTKGGPSRSSLASRTMAASGILLAVFLVVHVIQFRFGPGLQEGYVTSLDGREVRDFHRLVVDVFSSPWMVAFYVLSMFALGLHLWHGFWSAFQSLGVMNPRISGPVTVLGAILSVALAVGFLLIPIWIYVNFAGGGV